MRILLVDDSKAMRVIVRRQLGRLGVDDADVVEAANGTEALAAVHDAQPDLIVSNWNMPEMDGHQLLRTLRAEGNDVPLGFITSESTADMRMEASAAGALFVISKPFTAADFAPILSAVAA